MRTTSGVTLVAIGAILSFAISLNTGFISTRIVGLVLMLTGITGLCLNQRGTGLLERQLAALRYLLGQDGSMISGKRVPLDDLLRSAASSPSPATATASAAATATASAAAPPPWQSREAPSDDMAVHDTPTAPDIWVAHGAAQGLGAASRTAFKPESRRRAAR